MSIVDKIKSKNEEAQNEYTSDDNIPKSNLEVNMTQDELEFLIRLIGSSNFKGNDLMFIYNLVNKLQNLYLDKKGNA